MGQKKRKGGPTIEEVLERPWCFYCERDFDDLKILISHQRAKHYKCPQCSRRLNTAGGLSVHLHQVHKESLKEIENALPNRIDPNLEIFGMEGIPQDIIEMHRKRVTDEFFASESGQRALENGMNANGESKKRPKVEDETPEQIKARLEEHRARRRLEKERGITGGNSPAVNSPQPQNSIDSPSLTQASPITAASPTVFPPFSQPGLVAVPPQPYGMPGIPPHLPPFGAAYPPQPAAYPYQPQMPHEPLSGFPPFPPHAAPTLPSNMPRASPIQRAPSIPQSASPGPAIPGLPQRPSFQTPHLSKEQMASMHSTSSGSPFVPTKLSSNGPVASQKSPEPVTTDSVTGVTPTTTQSGQTNGSAYQLPSKPLPATADVGSANNTVPDAAATNAPTTHTADTAQPEVEGKKDKKSKKSKDDVVTRLVYSDKAVSPEEKMAKLKRYEPMWSQGNAPTTVVGDVGDGGDAASGAIDETVRDPQD